jgi:hypothetical protein
MATDIKTSNVDIGESTEKKKSFEPELEHLESSTIGEIIRSMSEDPDHPQNTNGTEKPINQTDNSILVDKVSDQAEDTLHKLNISQITVATEPFDVSMDSKNEISFSVPPATTQSDLLSDVFDEITELANGLASELFPDSDPPVSIDMETKVSPARKTVPQEDSDEPGRIVSALSRDNDGDQPFDEDEDKRESHDMSAIARMRYQRDMVQDPPSLASKTQPQKGRKEKSRALKGNNGNEGGKKNPSSTRPKNTDRTFDWEESLNIIKKPVNDVLQSTKASFLGLLNTFRDDESVYSDYSGSNDSFDDNSEYSGKSDASEEDNDDDGDESLPSPTRNSKSKSSLFLHSITNEGIRLIYYLPVHAASTSHDSNQPVKMFLQISNAKENEVEPYLVWEIRGNISPRRKKKYASLKISGDSISLFDISSIQIASDSIDIDIFPDAEAENSVLITMNNGTVHLFEAESQYEARNVVHGLRWVVARLTFNIIVGNVNVVAEMLSLGDGDGPNELNQEVLHDVSAQLVNKSLSKLDSVVVA